MTSGETVRCRKIRPNILRYHEPNKLLSREKFAHHMLLFHPFKDEKELLSHFPPL